MLAMSAAGGLAGATWSGARAQTPAAKRIEQFDPALEKIIFHDRADHGHRFRLRRAARLGRGTSLDQGGRLSVIPSFFEIKEVGGVRTLSEKNRIVGF
jgi:hypothetical protein